MTDFNAIMHQITALPQTLYLDFTGLLLRERLEKGWKQCWNYPYPRWGPAPNRLTAPPKGVKFEHLGGAQINPEISA